MDFGAAILTPARLRMGARFLNNVACGFVETSCAAVPVRGRRIEMGLLMLRVVAGLAVLAIWTGAAVAADRPGLVKEKPAAQPYVETPEGFMVPYAQKIPGTDATFQMIPVPGGKFLLGSPAKETGHKPDEAPQVEITVPPFWMARNEATWTEYRPFMEMFMVFKSFEGRGIRKVTDENKVDAITVPTELYEPTFTFEFGDDPQLPAVSMTQYAAKQYSKWISLTYGVQYRLPTEAEWEYACRAGSAAAYTYGNDPARLAEFAHFAGTSKGTGPRKVALGTPNAFGLYDMHGNVAEWTLDEYFDTGYEFLKGKADLTPTTAFVLPKQEWPRVVRGGSWENEAVDCRSASRLDSNMEKWKETDPNLPKSPWWMTNDPVRGVGFRLIRPLKEVPREEIEKVWGIDLETLQSDVDFRMIQGRGVYGIVDPGLPKAIDELRAEK
ncbi:Serine/threonine-protein kinase pkn1 [Planctomyces sp. SH-PL14]|nr:Serine/threonine-protein kinase pkn1 [Planctomyces sp. SH-PL14]